MNYTRHWSSVCFAEHIRIEGFTNRVLSFESMVCKTQFFCLMIGPCERCEHWCELQPMPP